MQTNSEISYIIAKLVSRKVMGTASEEELSRLQQWLDESPGHQRMYNEWIQRLSTDLRGKQPSDPYLAWHKFYVKQHPHKRRFMRPAYYGVAAVISLLIVVAGYLYYAASTPQKELPPIAKAIMKTVGLKGSVVEACPELTGDECTSLIKSNQMGKDQAELVVSGGKKIHLTSSVSKTSNGNIQPVKVQLLAAEQNSLKDNTIITQKNKEYWMTFEDGTIVHLNYNTSITYPAHFSDADRTIYLEGEAYFEVAKDSSRPFRVVTSSGVVTEYGTSFNVNTREKGNTKVVLIDGSISITPLHGRERMMRPGEMAIAQATTSEVAVSKVDTEPYVSWNKGHFSFDDYTLEKIMNVLSEWYEMKVIYKSNDIKNIHFTGTFNRYSSVRPVLNAMMKITNLDIQIKGSNIVLDKIQ